MNYPTLKDGSRNWCATCKHNGEECEYGEECFYQENADGTYNHDLKPTHYDDKPQTNYDRIVSKTPEELATFFGTLPCCPPGNADELCFPDNTCGADTKMMVKCWGTWLKAPVEVDE